MEVLDIPKVAAQVKMEGMPPIPKPISVSPKDLRRGPRYGSNGVVRDTLMRGALVDLGLSGRWRIPFHFLVPVTRVA